MKFSVLMSVYECEQPAHLKQALDSVFEQTLPPTEVVLVEDGPLTPELLAVIEDEQQLHSSLNVLSLKENQGLGNALNEGLKQCHHELVARMDTDDVCKKERFARQVGFMEQHPDVDVLGSWVDEFVGDISQVVSTRRPPEHHDEIVRFGRKRNPINHPSVMFRRESVERAGGYQHFYLFEDYYLWARMIQNGARFHNLPEALLFFRMSGNMFQRRGGLSYVRTEIAFQQKLHQTGYIGYGRMLKNISIRTAMRIIPNKMRRFFYLRVLR
ncbi:MAG: glycosyltransferase [Prevotella sp.]|nr:glycosyltransferase [Prevotella sp.]